MTTLAILTAAGSGTRLGRDVPKAFVEVAGTPMVVHAARRLAASGVVDAIVVTAPHRLVAAMSDVVGGDTQITVPVHVVAGGATRQESVAAGLAQADDGADVVLVHDAARPFASADLVRRVVAAVRAGNGAVVPGLPVVDTVKAVSAAPSATRTSGTVVEPVTSTPDRSVLRAVQTPQGFDRALLDRAHAAGAARDPDAHATDDAGLVEALGEQVVVVLGEEAALKITTERDLYLAGLYAEAPL
ncbi:2-C-methyl-D-erythritol 4-phosphate cytidylyltransferase [Xylanimonas cellulosilytica DSM 15894]|uniref:2-C-methyl-D-erythritol 4-phosphate cytidylyltransferase n=1 Tax=Xylanimonas cellulosilytica (strain DSM 15894 / JCM 12276 / CECT 5975 / KCTC 9989 / LMG 20990 / NBRC 107835 / XIL07) TaxID=446471 RepID=D1BZ67_XYLCX|nr:2-C-methyl-D-erythritol 4-phosphate cytidylyltransferase [Xylanimonas cellulosilytica]ACZ31964.1 2-C-methyl-D-erythritol 4-phosphate cytidylyltransferase [Xylanimonas cellulosilytica DSM 15894]